MDNLITVYIDCLEGSETVIEAVAQQCRDIKIKHECSEDACIFARNLEGMSKKCVLQLGKKLKKHIESFLDVNCPKNKAHMLFAFLLDPRFLQMKSLLKLHKLEKVNSIIIAADKKKYFFQEQSFVTDVTEMDYILPDILQVGLDTDERESSFSRVHRDFALYKNHVK